MDCVFCAIANGEIPSTKVYEDDTILAFKDLNPQAPVHILVVPKEHIKWGYDITPENSAVVAHIFEIIPVIAKEQGLTNGYRVINNCGESAGQSVLHLHFHILGGRDFGWPPG
jgi:histidine triad (HIT) family protein